MDKQTGESGSMDKQTGEGDPLIPIDNSLQPYDPPQTRIFNSFQNLLPQGFQGPNVDAIDKNFDAVDKNFDAVDKNFDVVVVDDEYNYLDVPKEYYNRSCCAYDLVSIRGHSIYVDKTSGTERCNSKMRWVFGLHDLVMVTYSNGSLVWLFLWLALLVGGIVMTALGAVGESSPSTPPIPLTAVPGTSGGSGFIILGIGCIGLLIGLFGVVRWVYLYFSVTSIYFYVRDSITISTGYIGAGYIDVKLGYEQAVQVRNYLIKHYNALQNVRPKIN